MKWNIKRLSIRNEVSACLWPDWPSTRSISLYLLPQPPLLSLIPLCLADWWSHWSFIRADLHSHLCTFSLSLLLPDLSWIDTGMWFTPPSPGHILASVKYSRTFPVLLDHFYITSTAALASSSSPRLIICRMFNIAPISKVTTGKNVKMCWADIVPVASQLWEDKNVLNSHCPAAPQTLPQASEQARNVKETFLVF